MVVERQLGPPLDIRVLPFQRRCLKLRLVKVQHSNSAEGIQRFVVSGYVPGANVYYAQNSRHDQNGNY